MYCLTQPFYRYLIIAFIYCGYRYPTLIYSFLEIKILIKMKCLILLNF